VKPPSGDSSTRKMSSFISFERLIEPAGP
jgi:hypothetical protein